MWLNVHEKMGFGRAGLYYWDEFPGRLPLRGKRFLAMGGPGNKKVSPCVGARLTSYNILFAFLLVFLYFSSFFSTSDLNTIQYHNFLAYCSFLQVQNNKKENRLDGRVVWSVCFWIGRLGVRFRVGSNQ